MVQRGCHAIRRLVFVRRGCHDGCCSFGGDAILPDTRSTSIVVVVVWGIADDGESSNGEARKMCASLRYNFLPYRCSVSILYYIGAFCHTFSHTELVQLIRIFVSHFERCWILDGMRPYTSI